MDDVVEAVRAACEGTAGLEAAFVFGSALTSPTPGDVDVAFLWEGGLPAAERWRRAERVAAAIERRLREGGLEVDVQDLRALPLVLQHRVLRDGRAVYVADRRAVVRFTSEVVPRALDFLPAWRSMLRASARRLARVRS